MAKLKSEIEVACPCCGALLVVDVNLGRVISHKEPEREDKPDLDAAQKILAEEKARREAVFLAVGGGGEDARRRVVETLRGGAAPGAERAGGPAAEEGVRPGLSRS